MVSNFDTHRRRVDCSKLIALRYFACEVRIVLVPGVILIHILSFQFAKNFSFRRKVARQEPSVIDVIAGDDTNVGQQDLVAADSKHAQDLLAQRGSLSSGTAASSRDNALSVNDRNAQALSEFTSQSLLQLRSENDELRSNPLGLKVLHRPREPRKADIIFVHGLGGSSRATWSKHRNPELFWPLKFLPTEPGVRECRILTFGYNSNFKPGSGKTRVSVLDFAKDLLYDLKYAQDDSEQGLGGLDLGTASLPSFPVTRVSIQVFCY